MLGFFLHSSAVLQRCHNRGWTSLFLLRRELTVEHSAGGDPDPLIVMWQRWPSQQGKEETALNCMLAIPPLPPLSNYSPSIIRICYSSTVIGLAYSDASDTNDLQQYCCHCTLDTGWVCSVANKSFVKLEPGWSKGRFFFDCQSYSDDIY